HAPRDLALRRLLVRRAAPPATVEVRHAAAGRRRAGHGLGLLDDADPGHRRPDLRINRPPAVGPPDPPGHPAHPCPHHHGLVPRRTAPGVPGRPHGPPAGDARPLRLPLAVRRQAAPPPGSIIAPVTA